VTDTTERNYVEQARRDKRAGLEAMGVNPFAYRFDRTHTAREAVDAYDDKMGDDGPMVSLAGRLVALRVQGKTTFAHLEDPSGRIQLYLKQEFLSGEYDLVMLLDLDDHVGVTGTLFRTRTGEVTVRAMAVSILAKSLRPLPRGKVQQTDEGTVTYGGLQDPEVRYRQRYADLAVHPEIRRVFETRAEVIRWMRRFLDERGFLEVETPILQPLYGGASARPFTTHHNALDMPLYLRIADELYLKRLVVGGMERVYEIGHDFRNEGMDRTHNPEFTMLECYQAYADYTDMMELVESMVSGLVQHLSGGPGVTFNGKALDFTPPWPRVRFVGGVLEHSGIDVLSATDAEMRARLVAHGMDGGRGGHPGGSAPDGRAFQGVPRAAPDPADLRGGLPEAALAAGQGAPRGSPPHGTLRVVHQWQGSGQRLQ
jgi:lysyl-tRNA synthetase, class II